MSNTIALLISYSSYHITIIIPGMHVIVNAVHPIPTDHDLIMIRFIDQHLCHRSMTFDFSVLVHVLIGVLCLQQAEVLINNHVHPHTASYLYRICMVLTGPITEDQNTRGRKVYDPEKTSQSFGFMLASQIPTVSNGKGFHCFDACLEFLSALRSPFTFGAREDLTND